MTPPSTPTGPQRGPRNLHAPETRRDPEKGRETEKLRESEGPRKAEIQSFPDLQDGPDPAPPLKISDGNPVRKRVVKPSVPERQPAPSSSSSPTSSSRTSPSRFRSSSPASTPAKSDYTPASTPSKSDSSQPSTPVQTDSTQHPSLSAQSQHPASSQRQERPAGDEATADETEPLSARGPAGEPVASTPVPGPLSNPQDLNRATFPIGLIRRTAVSAVTAVVVASAVSVTADTNSGTGLAAFDPQAVLDPAGSLIAPAVMMWWLWLPIAAGWLVYALYQWLPRQRTNPRQEWIGWLVVASELLALCWLLAAASGAAAGILVLAAAQTSLGLYCLHRVNVSPPATRTEGLLADVPLGMFLVAAVFSLTTSLAFILTGSDADLAGWGGPAWALIALVSVTVGVNIVCMTDRGHLCVALATVWALSCVAGGRFLGAPDSTLIGAAAAASAFLVLVSAGSRRHQVDHERRRNERLIQT